jgi:polyisoprenoid-binding protein YceI
MTFLRVRAASALALCGLAAWSAPTAAEVASYELDPNHTTVAFMVDHLGYAKVLGMFRAARGSYDFDEASGTLGKVRIEVDTQSVFSNYAKRDQHLKSADFLNTAQFPRMVFTAEGGRRTGERSYEIAGQLELLGRLQPMTLNATWNKSGPSPVDKVYTMGVSARGSFKRSGHGMNYGVANQWVGDEVPLLIEFEAQRK